MSTDPPNPNAPRKKWFRSTCFGRSRARQPRGQHPAVATSTGRHSSRTTSPPPPADKETILQWTKITLKMSEKVLGMVPIARLDKIPSLLLEFVAIYEVMHDALRLCSSSLFICFSQKVEYNNDRLRDLEKRIKALSTVLEPLEDLDPDAETVLKEPIEIFKSFVPHSYPFANTGTNIDFDSELDGLNAQLRRVHERGQYKNMDYNSTELARIRASVDYALDSLTVRPMCHSLGIQKVLTYGLDRQRLPPPRSDYWPSLQR